MVKFLDKLEEPFKTDYGVSHGSVLGPFLLTLYTTSLRSLSFHFSPLRVIARVLRDSYMF